MVHTLNMVLWCTSIVLSTLLLVDVISHLLCACYMRYDKVVTSDITPIV